MTSENREKLKKSWDRYTSREFNDRDKNLPPMPDGELTLVYACVNGQLYEVVFNTCTYSWIYRVNEEVLCEIPSNLSDLLKTLDSGKWALLLERCRTYDRQRASKGGWA